jgi:hypothetical protein
MIDDYKLGISDRTWTYIGAASAGLLLLTAGKSIANEIGKEGLFGYGKSKRLASFGKTKEATWGNLQNLSLLFVGLTLLESNYEALERVKKVNIKAKIPESFF